jgi:plasmid replication initiation protein
MKETTKNKRMVYQANDVTSAAYTMTLNEKRLLLLAISNNRDSYGIQRDDHGCLVVKVTAAEWAQVYGGKQDHAYTEIKEASTKLFGRHVHLSKDHVDADLRWLSAQFYSVGEGWVELEFTPRVSALLCELQEKFTKFDLLAVSDMKSVNTIRVYELVTQFRSTGFREIDVADFRACLGLTTEYPEFRHLRQYVIDPSVKEINAKSDMDVEWSPKKKGRNITALNFSCVVKKQADLLENNRDTTAKKPKIKATGFIDKHTDTSWREGI